MLRHTASRHLRLRFAFASWRSYTVPANTMVKSQYDTAWDPEAELPAQIKELLHRPKSSSYSYLLAFQQIINLLKTQKRTGWLNHEIANPESIADHMYRMSLIAMSLNSRNFAQEDKGESVTHKIDLDKCCKIALVHDLAEALVGDIVPHDANIDKVEKGKREYKTILYLAEMVKHYNPEFAVEMCELWLDYEEQRNFDAKIVKDIDKYELLITAFQYEQEYAGTKDLEEFFGARKMIKTEEIGKIADELIAERTQFWRKIKSQ